MVTKQSTSLLLLIINDVIAVAVAIIVAYWFRFHSGIIPYLPGREGYEAMEYYRLFPIFTVVWIIALASMKLYGKRAIIWGGSVFAGIVKGSIAALAVFVLIDFFFHLSFTSTL